MTQTDPFRDKRLMQDYLLGILTPDQRSQLEERFFSDDDSFDLLEEARCELLDDYARGVLPADRAQLVQELLARSSTAASSLAVARGLAASPPVMPRRIHRIFVPIAATLAALGLGLAAWMMIENRRLRTEIVQTSTPVMASIQLTGAASRAPSATPVFLIPKAAEMVRVSLSVSEPDSPVQVTIESPSSGRVLHMQGIVRGAGNPVSVIVPAAAIPDGDYEFIVTRSGSDPVVLGTFPCQISRR